MCAQQGLCDAGSSVLGRTLGDTWPGRERTLGRMFGFSSLLELKKQLEVGCESRPVPSLGRYIGIDERLYVTGVLNFLRSCRSMGISGGACPKSLLWSF